jgi:Xaa-Pro dipeptidase
MHGPGLDTIVATSPANVAYLTGYHNRLEVETLEFMLTPGGGTERAFSTFAAATLNDHAPALIVPAIFAAGAVGLDAALYPVGKADFDFGHAKRLAGHNDALIQMLEARQLPTPVDGLIRALRDRGVDRGRIGVELAGVSRPIRRLMLAGLPHAEVRDCTNVFRLLRAVKTPGEIELLRKAALTAEAAVADTLSEARAGLSLHEVTGRFRQLLAEADAEVDHFAFSPRGAGIAMHFAGKLQKHDVAYVDYGCIREHVRSDSGLTFALSRPGADQLARFGVLNDAVCAGAEHLRPGIRTSRVWQAMRDVVGRSDVVSSPQGHGLGLEAREYPLIAPARRARIRDGCINISADLELETGMVVNLEVSTFSPGLASMHVERSFVVAAGGSTPLIPETLDRLLVAEDVIRYERQTT